MNALSLIIVHQSLPHLFITLATKLKQQLQKFMNIQNHLLANRDVKSPPLFHWIIRALPVSVMS